MIERPAPTVQRAGVFVELPALLRELGVAPEPLFTAAGLATEALTADTRLPFKPGLGLLHAAALATGRPQLGLLLGSRFRLSHHGVIGRLMANAPTLRQAMQDFVTWQPGYSSGAVVYIGHARDTVALGYGIQEQSAVGRRQLYDIAMAVGMRMMAELLGRPVTPEAVCFSYSEPADTAAYKRAFRTDVAFGCDRTCIIVDARTSGARLPGADPAMRKNILGELDRLTTGSAHRTSEQLRRVLRPLLHTSRPSIADAAAAMNLHPRTLRRRLAAEDAVFTNLRDEVRFAMARELLDMTDLPVSEIATAIAYASPGVFTDAFRRLSGVSPTEWRARAGTGD